MSNRLNQEREEKLTPLRFKRVVKELQDRGFDVDIYETSIEFIFMESKIIYFPYSGWATGKTIKDGRGLKPLLRQLKGGK